MALIPSTVSVAEYRLAITRHPQTLTSWSRLLSLHTCWQSLVSLFWCKQFSSTSFSLSNAWDFQAATQTCLLHIFHSDFTSWLFVHAQHTTLDCNVTISWATLKVQPDWLNRSHSQMDVNRFTGWIGYCISMHLYAKVYHTTIIIYRVK